MVEKKRYTKNFSEVSVNQPAYTLYDSEGNAVQTTNTLPEGVTAGQKVYRDSSGNLTAKPETKVELDTETGKIKVKAPDLAIKNETFKSSLTESLKTLSHNYKLNPKYKYSVTNESGVNEEKSIEDIINDMNKPAKNEDGTINSSSLEYMASAAEGLERKKAAHAKNRELNDEDIIRIETVAIGPDVKDNTPQLISDLPEAWWLRNVDTYDKNTGTAQYKDIMENAYNKEKVSSEDMIKLWAALENYFAKGDYSDKEEYIRNVATARFLDATQPNMSWIRDVTENVNALLNSIGGYATELGTAAWVAVEKVGNAVFGIPDEYYDYYGNDYGNLSIVRGGNQFATGMPTEKVDAKIGRIRFDEDGAPSYVEEKIEGGIENPRTTGEMLRAIFKENQAVIRKDLQYLHSSQAAWDAVGYELMNLAAFISAGNALSNAFVVGSGALANKVAMVAGKTVATINDLTSTARALYATGTALNFGTTAADVAQIVSGMKTIYDIAAITGKAATFLNFIGKAVMASEATVGIIGVVGESIAEAVVGDNNRLIEVLTNKEIDTDTKNYLIETYIWNAVGWGVGLGVGKFLMKAGETVVGRAISANLSRRLFKIQNSVGEAFDQAMLTIRRVKGDDLVEKIKTLYEEGGKYAKKQANALAASADLRKMREAIVESTEAIQISGKSADEIEEALADIERKVNELKKAEVALTSMQRQGVDIVQGWLKDEGKGLKEVTENFYAKAAQVAELEKAAGDLFRPTKGVVSDMISGKPLKLFSQTTTNYIKASEKIDFINAYIRKYEHAEKVTQDVLDKIKKYREELPELQGMVNTFLQNAPSSLRLAANNFIDADRKWWAKYENLRASLGLTDADELAWFRGSNLWGTNGGLYARTTRKADLSEYVIKHRDGTSNVRTFDNYEQYMAGATGDFSDPMGEMQIALYDAGNKQAYRSFAKTYNKLTGTAMVKVTGEETALYQKMKKGLRSGYFESSTVLLKGMSEDVGSKGVIDDLIKNLKTESTQYGDIKKTKGAMKTAVKNLQKELTEVTSENANKYIVRLGAEDTNALWDDFYDVSVRELVEGGGDAVPIQARRFIYGQARELGLTDVDSEQLLETSSGRKSRLLSTYDNVNKALAGTADTPDATFEQQVKRLIMSHDENIINNAKVQKSLTERERLEYITRNELFYKQKAEELEFLEKQYGITKEEISVAGGTTVRGYIEDMTQKGTPQRNAIDELCRYYGLEGDENAIEYFALSAYMDNRPKYKHELATQIKKAVEEEHPELKFKKAGGKKSQAEKVAGILTEGIDSTIEYEFDNARLVVKELNPAATRADDEKVMKEIDRIAKEIEGAEANRYAGEKNIIAMRNMQGKVEYFQTDPLLARLVNFQYLPEKMNGFTQAVYNTNYLWAKLFRLGTTAINIKSMVAQSFRDPINMFIGGGAYRTTQQCMDDIVDVFGDDLVAWVKTYEPEALARLEKKAERTGESLQKLVVEREFDIGRGLSPTTTETWMYRSLNTAKRARLNGVLDIYDDTLGDKFVRKIDWVNDQFGLANEWREKTLRNLSYQNGLSTALKRGYTVDEARTFATFVMNEATTNFTRMTNHLVSLKDTVPYFGSAVNGSKSFFKLLSMDPVGVTGRLVGGIIIPSVALTAYSLLDERNREVYKNIPEYQKEDALVFVVGGQIISIPIPQELGSFVAPFRQMVEGLYGVSTNTFAELAWHDILGFSPVDLTGFANLDFAKLETSSPGFLDRIGDGIARMWAQLAPPVLKSGLEIVTGVDPYTGKAIDKSYLDYDENGNPIVRDYQSGELAKLLNNMFRSWGLTSSAPVVQNILANIMGQGSVDILDFLVSLGTQVPNGGWAFSATERQLATGEGYNPFYVIGTRLTDPVTMDAYNEAQSAWKTEVAKLYNMKTEILRSDAWKEYLEAKRSENDPEKLQNINSSKKDLVSKYFDTVKNVVNNLQTNYGEEFTAAKYATVLSLMTMEEQTLDAGSYGDYLNKEEYKTARAQAIQTMINLGFPSSSSTDILGKFVTNNSGEITVKTYSPLAILQLDDTSGAALYSQSGKHHEAAIRELINSSNIYELREKYYNEVDAAYDAEDYNKVEKLKNDYDEKVISVIAPYIRQYTPESVLTNDVINYLEGYIFVPSDSMGRGKYYSSKTGLNKNEGYIKSYLKAIFNYGGNSIK